MERLRHFDEKDFPVIVYAKLESMVSFTSAYPMLNRIVSAFIIKTVAADGILDKSELETLMASRPQFVQSKGLSEAITNKVYEFIREGYDLANLIYQFKGYPEHIRDEVVLTCLMLASVDGEIAGEEADWLRTISF